MTEDDQALAGLCENTVNGLAVLATPLCCLPLHKVSAYIERDVVNRMDVHLRTNGRCAAPLTYPQQ